MSTFSVKQILAGQAPADQPVTVKGWVRTRRDSKAGISFVNLSDGSCFNPVQIVAPATLGNYADEVVRLTAGCSVEATGLIVPSPAKGQPFELQASELKVVGWVDDPDTYPIQPKPHTMEYLREVAHLRARTNVIGAATRVRHTIAQAIHRFFDEQGFFWVNTPIITASDAEGAGELFRVSTLDMMNLPRTPDGKIDFSKDFFGREAFLTVSGQLNVETYCMAMSKVYTFGPTFRAENSNTSRHLAEFWMIEPEIAFANLADDATLAEAMLKYVFQAVLNERADDMEFFEERIEKGVIARLRQMIDTPFVRMDYSEAIGILQAAKEKFDYPVQWGTDLQSEHERYLAERHVKGPLVLMNYPKEIKAFYMRLNDDGKTVAAMDVLAPGIGEIIGGSQREERLDVLDARMAEVGLDPAHYGWYRDLRRYGTVPHAGFGLGFERTISYITGLANVRDVIPFPRTPGTARY
ncbi:asparagine--tRNA ligase [Propionivibrio dicarboxylicus]|uniref:Asparagine--tRNA ligase n=1 Tax=Propionivibrio dicarboxylicus TaxID=83767 RepID=A0A1G8GC02_9RHOO|nr:asparagine--tRNA ligase [Propionivibrio dicarboxylicus]SDH91952.1 asparaginyl-tRNA synthetase [Propionivibrio dicarboxylicus]